MTSDKKKALQKEMKIDTSMMLYTWEESQSSSLSESRCFLSFDSDPSARNLRDCENVKRALFDDWTAEHGEEVKQSRKEQYSRGISEAASYIADYVSKYKYFGLNEIDTVTAILVLGDKIDFSSKIGKNFLKKMNTIDCDFVEIAFLSAAKIKELGGKSMDMKAAVVSVLACRGFRYIRNSMLTRETIEEISQSTALTVMNRNKSSTENDTETQITLQETQSLDTPSQNEKKTEAPQESLSLALHVYKPWEQCPIDTIESVLRFLCLKT